VISTNRSSSKQKSRSLQQPPVSSLRRCLILLPDQPESGRESDFYILQNVKAIPTFVKSFFWIFAHFSPARRRPQAVRPAVGMSWLLHDPAPLCAPEPSKPKYQYWQRGFGRPMKMTGSTGRPLGRPVAGTGCGNSPGEKNFPSSGMSPKTAAFFQGRSPATVHRRQERYKHKSPGQTGQPQPVSNSQPGAMNCHRSGNHVCRAHFCCF